MMIRKELNIVVMPDGTFQMEWTETEASITKDIDLIQWEIYSRFSTALDTWLFFLGFYDEVADLSPSLSFFRQFAGIFIRKLSRTSDLEILRDSVSLDINDDEIIQVLDSVPMMAGSEYINVDLIKTIWGNLSKTFSGLIKNYKGSVKSFLRELSPDIHLVGRVFFHLVENKKGDLPFAFLATYSTGAGSQGKSKHLPLKHALKEYEDDSQKMLDLLSTVHAAMEKSSLISTLVETGELFHPLAWSADEAFQFLKEISLYEESGILCRIPNWWKGRGSDSRLSISIGEKKPPFIGMEAILSFDAQLMLGDMVISKAEARQLLEESQGLAFIKNRWVSVDSEKLAQTLDVYEKAKKMSDKEGFSILDAMRMQLNPDKIPGLELNGVEVAVSSGDWLKSVIEKLKNPDLTPAVTPGKGFKARLREYQQKGLNWLYFLHSLGFGACLADDMGLGKTVQLLAFLNVINDFKEKGASLLVMPASLISNWTNEIQKFYPSLKYFVAHPDFNPEKQVGMKSTEDLDRIDLVITTYSQAQRYHWLKEYTWAYVILDEAQAIKNPGAKQTRAIKTFKAKNRITLTGTPIENRLTDLWSLFDFLNPGLLGNKTEFSKFIKGLKNNPHGYKRLRSLISPYLLRRLKTDKSIISDLPNKVEMKTYASLTKKQVILYQNMVRELAEAIDKTEGIQRKGLVLASLIIFKQLCNHPDQYLGTGDYEEKDSGKFTRLREICETIYEKREKVIVFTQFKEMTGPLCAFLETIFGRKGLLLHGSIPVVKRKNIIERFQSDEYVPFFVLSLKAGGVGLNLTRANHVIHFDRWWNPAVENQATDRAFRIGQKRNVMVHKFLTKGTIEEKIDNMLDEKKELSEKVISATGEAWITEMDNDQLIDLFSLSL